ncbi:histidine phosphatase family protein [Enterococcus hulanensis]|uniref:histidine phosphatase family protein n=1 Tax=Enterococcus hulanensis TaxID=2559929 RepID=UPI001A8CCA32|nr:histidine phosphatase family protein [Enterococcus hulanensis]MBO0458235.1 histidine phosphatase family protein [Enterococcus hulanensis]
MKIYFVRHGETYLNKYKKMQGWSDSPLTPQGEKVAYETGEKLKNIPFSTVYTSDLGRTIQTARLILEGNRHFDSENIQPLKELRETFFGSFEADLGSNVYPKVAEKHGISVSDVFGKLSLNQISDTMKELDPYDDAESSKEFENRLLKGLSKITDNSEEKNEVLVVTHGNTIRHIVKKISPTTNVFQEIGNSSVTTVDYQNGQLKLLTFNA